MKMTVTVNSQNKIKQNKMIHNKTKQIIKQTQKLIISSKFS